MKKVLFVIASMAILTSCVTKKQYNDVLASEKKYYEEAQNAKKELSSQKATIEDLNAEIDRLNKEIESLKSDTLSQSKAIYSLKDDIAKLNSLNSELTEKLGKSKSEEEVKILLANLQKLQDALQAKEAELNSLERSLEESKRELSAKQANLEQQQSLTAQQQQELNEQNAKLKELTDILSKKDSLMRELKNRVSQALVGFEGNGLAVTNKNGKVYVSLDEQLLFKSGKWDVDEKGVNALENLSKVLAENPDIHVVIEGHTDNIPYNGSGQITDNWDLSVKRATAIVHIILKNRSIDPTRITASGRGEFMPIDKANTSEARQKNRRTEIILSPNFDELMNLLSAE